MFKHGFPKALAVLVTLLPLAFAATVNASGGVTFTDISAGGAAGLDYERAPSASIAIFDLLTTFPVFTMNDLPLSTLRRGDQEAQHQGQRHRPYRGEDRQADPRLGVQVSGSQARASGVGERATDGAEEPRDEWSRTQKRKGRQRGGKLTPESDDPRWREPGSGGATEVEHSQTAVDRIDDRTRRAEEKDGAPRLTTGDWRQPPGLEDQQRRHHCRPE